MQFVACNRTAKLSSQISSLFILAATIIFLPIPFSSTHAAEFIPLGWLGADSAGSLSSGAGDISDDGRIVVGRSTTTVGDSHAVFRWNQMDGMDGVGSDVPGRSPQISADGSTTVWSATQSDETAIWSESFGLVTVPQFTNADDQFRMSSNGEIVAGTNPSYFPGFGLPVIWSETNGFRNIPVPADVVETRYGSVGISLDGSTVFGVFGQRTTVPCADCGLPFLWTEADGTIMLGSVPGDNSYSILGASEDGSALFGTSYYFDQPNGGAPTPSSLWRWTNTTGMTVIAEGNGSRDFLGPWSPGTPKRSSSDGTIFAATSEGPSGQSAYLWTGDGGLQQLPGLPGFDEHGVVEVSNDGSVIFGFSQNRSSGDVDVQGWVWTDSIGTRSLVDILVSQGVPSNVLSEWLLWNGIPAWTLSGNGTAIAGSGTNPDGIREAWVAYFDPHLIPEPTADFNGDGNLDCTDIDALVAEVAAGTNGIAFDLTGDGTVDVGDVTEWLADAGAINNASGNPYFPGDANLDGTVDTSDFNIWNSNKFNVAPAWCSGDFTADGLIDVADFNAWNSHRFFSSDAPSSVPEPSASCLLLVAGLLGCLRQRK